MLWHRPAQDGKAPRDGRCSSIALHCRSHGNVRGKLAGCKPVRALPIGACSKRDNSNYVGGAQTQAPHPEEPGILHKQQVVAIDRSRQRSSTRREGQEGRWTRQRKRKAAGQGQVLGGKRRRECVEGQQGGPPEEDLAVSPGPVSQNSLQAAGLTAELAQAVLLPPGLEDGISMFGLLASRCTSLECIGRAIAWMLFNIPRLEMEGGLEPYAAQMIFGKAKVNFAMHRGPVPRHRPLFPLPLGELGKVKELARRAALDDFIRPHFADLAGCEVWTAVAVLGLNGVAGYGRAELQRRPTELQQRAIGCLRESINRVLSGDVTLERSAAAAEKELLLRFVNYTGEEVPKMQVLCLEGAEPALPPATHGGSIDARALASEGTQWFLDHPEESLLEQGEPKVKLQAKVHIAPGEALEFCKLLVSRNICTWVLDDDVLEVGGQKVSKRNVCCWKGFFCG